MSDPIIVHHFNNIKIELARMFQSRNKSKIDIFLSKVNTTRSTIKNMPACEFEKDLLSIPEISRIIEEFDFLLNTYSKTKKVVNIIQLAKIFEKNKENFTEIIKYFEFVSNKKEINELLSFFNCTWKDINAHNVKGQFIIDFPKVNQISNGERDVLCFIGQLFQARNILRKDKSILIIDEIFDYLDDANLISVQYYLMKFIEHFKHSDKELFPIILTHLDPLFFNTYSFSTKNIVYLEKNCTITNKFGINSLLKDRSECKKSNRNAYDRISSNYLHYSVDKTDEATYLQSIGVEDKLHTPERFRNVAFEELKNYQNEGPYDPALVCCGLRIFIEKKACEQLSLEYQNEFISEYKKTYDKLLFARGKGAHIPEVFYLLSIIYNEAMHLDPQCQKLTPITYKLKNKVIHKMISEVLDHN
jgi:hypothetical protein